MFAAITWIFGLIKGIPGIGAIIERFTAGNAEAEKIRAQTELVEAEAFKEGRVAPRYMKQYVFIGAFTIVLILIVVSAFFPEVSEVTDSIVDRVAKASKTLMVF